VTFVRASCVGAERENEQVWVVDLSVVSRFWDFGTFRSELVFFGGLVLYSRSSRVLSALVGRMALVASPMV